MEEFPKLVNSHDDSVISVNNSSFLIGRSLSCDHIIQSLGVSRFHCVIKKNDDKWTLFDRSTNGTIVNTTLYKFNESVDLNHGDIIKLGPTNLDYVFTVGKSTEAPITEPQGEIIPEDVAQEFEHPFELDTPKTEEKPQEKPQSSQNLDIMENELTCSICSELFIKAVTLNCSHTYCKFCIEEWKKSKSSCPICRKFITNVSPTLVLDNYIEKIIETQSDEVKETRKALRQQRDEIIANVASSSNLQSDGIEMDPVIEIFSENDDDEDEDSDYNYLSDDHDYDVYDCYFDSRPFVGPRGRYYGGYGRCFICNQTGHWANSCPFKNR